MNVHQARTMAASPIAETPYTETCNCTLVQLYSIIPNPHNNNWGSTYSSYPPPHMSVYTSTSPLLQGTLRLRISMNQHKHRQPFLQRLPTLQIPRPRKHRRPRLRTNRMRTRQQVLNSLLHITHLRLRNHRIDFPSLRFCHD